MHTMRTTDGWELTTVEQHGAYVGHEMGRLWLKKPQSRTNAWIWYAFDSVRDAARALRVAETMSQAAFEAWHSDTWRVFPGRETSQVDTLGKPARAGKYYIEPDTYEGDVLWSPGFETQAEAYEWAARHPGEEY